MDANYLTDTAEEWRAIPGYEGLYEVSNFGRVKSLNYLGSPGVEKILSIKGGHRYSGVKLSRGGLVYRALVHVQVAAAFIGPKPIGLVVNHKNGNGYDNRLENLEYVTQSENALHGYRIGTHTPTRGERNPQSKITADDVREIRDLLLQGLTHSSIAARFNLCRQTAGLIANNKRWSHLS